MMRVFLLVLGAFLFAGCDAGEVLGTSGLVVGALIPLVSLVVGLTKTPKDDAILAKVLPFLSFLQPKDAPGTLKFPLSPPSKPEQ